MFTVTGEPKVLPLIELMEEALAIFFKVREAEPLTLYPPEYGTVHDALALTVLLPSELCLIPVNFTEPKFFEPFAPIL